MPSKRYSKSLVKQICEARREAKTAKEIAKQFGLSAKCLRTWQNKHEFFQQEWTKASFDMIHTLQDRLIDLGRSKMPPDLDRAAARAWDSDRRAEIDSLKFLIARMIGLEKVFKVQHEHSGQVNGNIGMQIQVMNYATEKAIDVIDLQPEELKANKQEDDYIKSISHESKE